MTDEQGVRAALTNPETTATLANAIVIGRYGEEAYYWDLATVYLELKDDYFVEPSAQFLDRFGAMQVLMTSDAFFTRVDAFMSICNTFADGEPSFGMFDPPTLEEMAWGVTETALNRDMLTFSPAIRTLVTTMAARDGFGAGDLPKALTAVLEGGTAAGVRAAASAAEANDGVIETYIAEQLEDLVYQFDKIGGLQDLDDRIMRVGAVRALQELENAF